MTDCEFIICHLISHSETGNLNIARIHRLIVCFNFISSKQFLSGAFVFVICLFLFCLGRTVLIMTVCKIVLNSTVNQFIMELNVIHAKL